MKRPRMLLMMLLFCAMAGGCNDSPAEPDCATGAEELRPNITLADLRRLCHETTVIVHEELRIGGQVVSSDEAGNFYHTLVIDDGTGGGELRIDAYDLHTIYPPGNLLTVSLQGCALGSRNGILQIGMPPAPYSPYPTEEIASRVLLERILHPSNRREEVMPINIAIADLHEELCGRLVQIEGLHFIPEAEVTETATWSGYTMFRSADGETMAVYTSRYARFADRAVPAGSCTLTGVLEYGSVAGHGTQFILQLRHEGDCTIR